MRTHQSIVALVAAVAACITLSGCAAPQRSFGEPMKLADAETISVGKLLADPTPYEGKYVRVSGQVVTVCESAGCWMDIADSPEKSAPRLFVKFTCPGEGGRLIPMEAVGHAAVVEGVLKLDEISEQAARHIADESGIPKEEVARITGPQKKPRLESPAAAIRGLKAPSAAAS